MGENRKDLTWDLTFITKAHDFSRILKSGVRESNPPPSLGKALYYRCTNPANTGIQNNKKARDGIRTRDPRLGKAILHH